MSTFKRLAALLAMASATWAASDDDRAQDLFQQHRWFDLRDVAVADRYAAALIKGSLASAFNRPAEAEAELKQAIRLGKGTEQLTTAREKLVVLYLRQGRTRDAVLELRAALRRDPTRADLQGLLGLFAPIERYPRFAVRAPKGEAPLPCEVKPDGVWLALEINGKAETWLVDTGSNFSVVNESEAKALGVVAHESGASAGETHSKSGVIERLRAGGIELRNVPVLIVPDGQPPWTAWAAGRRGILGLPVLIALQSLRWTREGVCTAGANLGASTNMAFDDLNPVLRGTLANKPVEFLLDTGNQAETQLWTRFQADFASLATGEAVSTKITQIGGVQERPTLAIPELRFNIGGLAAVLKPALLFAKPVGNDYQHGLLGMDVFRQAREITIDFRTMTFTATLTAR